MLRSTTGTLAEGWWLRSIRHRSPVIRFLAISGTAIALALPIGVIIGLLGPLFGPAVIIGLLTAYFVLRSPLLALCAVLGVILVLPFAALPVNVGFAPTLLDLALGAAYLIAISRTVLHKDRETILESPSGGMLIFASLAIFAFILGLTYAPLSTTVVRHFAELLLAVFSFALVLNIVRTRQQLVLAAAVLVGGGTIAALIAVALYVIPASMAQRILNGLSALRYPSGDVLRYIEDDPAQAMRAIGTSVDPNVLGGVLIFGTVMAAALFLSAKDKRQRWLLGGATGVMTIAIILTYSRSAFVGLAAGLGLMVALRKPKLLWAGLGALVVLMLLPQMQDYVARMVEGFLGQDLATQMRLGEYKDAFTLIGRHPWIGVGFTGTAEIDTYLGVSSVYLLIAEEMGLIGMAAFIITMIIFLVRFLAQRHLLADDAELEGIGYGAAMGLFGSLVAGIADHYLFNLEFPHAATLLWMMLGLGAVALRLAKLPPAQRDGVSTPGDRRHWIVRAFFPEAPRARSGAGPRPKESSS